MCLFSFFSGFISRSGIAGSYSITVLVFKKLFIYFIFGHAGPLLLCRLSSVVVVNRGYSLVSVSETEVSLAVTSLVAEHRL